MRCVLLKFKLLDKKAFEFFCHLLSFVRLHVESAEDFVYFFFFFLEGKNTSVTSERKVKKERGQETGKINKREEESTPQRTSEPLKVMRNPAV